MPDIWSRVIPHEVVSLHDWVEVWMKCAATTGILRQAPHNNFVQEM
ncbi:MAG TPA: hypothetical protein VK638_51310 [Edaphobacter sp.]|nr:hypothetical protein [Edaphobacter sp.]